MKPQEWPWLFSWCRWSFTEQAQLNVALGGGREGVGGAAKRNMEFPLLFGIFYLLEKPALNSNLQKQEPCFTAILHVPSIQDT